VTARILVVDDDPRLRQLAKDVLEEHDYVVETAADTDEGFKKLAAVRPDLLILDVWMPSISGLEFCRRVRQNPDMRTLPVLMLTVQDREMDKVMGLEMGADDYMTKPFSQRELVARIKALLRRYERVHAGGAGPLSSGDLTVDMTSHQALLKGKPLPLTPKEFGLLVELLRNRRKALSREALLGAVWGPETPSHEGTIDVHIRHLRNKLSAHGDKIKTVLGFGYRFDG
jgi:two-component system alkaline phosphatase synthesis response regulator PhoP